MVVVQSRVQRVRKAPERSSAQGAGAHNRRRHGAVTPEEFGESDPDGDELELASSLSATTLIPVYPTFNES